MAGVTKMPIGQYTPQTALGRVDLGMRAASAGKDPTTELQTLAMNDQLLRQREQDMHLQALEAQAKKQESMLQAESAEAKRLAGISTGIQDALATSGQHLADLYTDGNIEGVKNYWHALRQRVQATEEEMAQFVPLNDPQAMVGYASDIEKTYGYGAIHDEKSLSDKDVEREKSRLVEGRDVRGDVRQEKIDQRKVRADQLREDIIAIGGKFDPTTVKAVYSTGMGAEAVNEAVVVARSSLTKILGASDLAAKEMKNKQQGGVKTDSLSFKFGVALQKEYTKRVDADVRVWESMSPNQKLFAPEKRPKTADEYRAAALEEVVSMTALDGEPQSHVTKKLEKDRKTFANEMMRSPDPQVQAEVDKVAVMITQTEAHARLTQAIADGRITPEQGRKKEEEMMQTVLVARYYGKPVIRGLVTGSEFQRSPSLNRPSGGKASYYNQRRGREI